MRGTRDEYLGLMKGAPTLAATALDGDGEALLVALAEFLVEATRQDEQRRLLAEARKAAEKAAQDLSAAGKRLQQASDEHGSALAGEEERRSAWATWLREHRMEETFRSRGRLYAQRRDLVQSMAEHEERVKKVAGETELTALRLELADKALPGLNVAQQEARQWVHELETGLGELQQEKARCDERRRQLLDEDNIARLRAQEEGLLERYRELAEDWARHAAALHLLSAAKGRFEKSHQPEVIRRAGEYFRGITDGRYKEVFAPHGEQTVEVIDDHDRRVAVENLSRGTSEQLYLAIRFGYIASQDANRERLPLLMDDVMANFDPTRATHAAQGILEMAETHQVLFFTCHPEVVEVFRGHKGDVPVCRVGSGGIGL